MTDMLIEE